MKKLMGLILCLMLALLLSACTQAAPSDPVQDNGAPESQLNGSAIVWMA